MDGARSDWRKCKGSKGHKRGLEDGGTRDEEEGWDEEGTREGETLSEGVNGNGR